MRGYTIESHEEAIQAGLWLAKWSSYGNFWKSEHKYTSAPTAQDDYQAVLNALRIYMARNNIPIISNWRI